MFYIFQALQPHLITQTFWYKCKVSGPMGGPWWPHQVLFCLRSHRRRYTAVSKGWAVLLVTSYAKSVEMAFSAIFIDFSQFRPFRCMHFNLVLFFTPLTDTCSVYNHACSYVPRSWKSECCFSLIMTSQQCFQSLPAWPSRSSSLTVSAACEHPAGWC